jgi:UV DNA damage repair endonuclease
MNTTQDNTMGKIGFACKYMHLDQSLSKKVLEEIQRPLNTRSTTVQWLNRQPQAVAEQRLWDIMEHNIASYKGLVEYVSTLPQGLRMVRLGSDCLPVYTHATWSWFWKRADVRA